MKRYDIYTDINNLENYGFSKTRYGRYILEPPEHNVVLAVVEENGKTKFNSVSSYTIKVICELYADGKIRFEPFKSERKQNMLLTESERKLILQLREKENERKN